MPIVFYFILFYYMGMRGKGLLTLTCMLSGYREKNSFSCLISLVTVWISVEALLVFDKWCIKHKKVIHQISRHLSLSWRGLEEWVLITITWWHFWKVSFEFLQELLMIWETICDVKGSLCSRRTTVHFDSIYFLIVAMLRYHEDIVVVYINNHCQGNLF